MSEILQSVSLLDDSGLANGCNSRLSGQNTSKSSRGAFNLKVESSRNGVLGQAEGGAEAGQGLYAAGKYKAQSCTCGRAFPGPAAGWNGCGGMLCFPTDAALYNNGERSPGNRSAVHVPTQRAAPAIAACCIGYRTVVPAGSEKQSLREVKSVPSGS